MKERSQEIALYGERCSGTNFIAEILRLNSGCKVSYPLGFKHFPKTFPVEEQRRLLLGRPVLFLIRHPESWVRSMFLNPWHAMKDIREKDFSDFLRAEWHSVWDEEANVFPGNPRYGQPIKEDRDPLTGKPFPNLLRMRTAKIHRFQEIESCSERSCWVRLEDLVDDQEAIYRKTAGALGLPVSDEYTPVFAYKGNASWRSELLRRVGLGRLNASARREGRKPPLGPADRDFIWTELDAATEASFGYAPGIRRNEIEGKGG